MYHLTPQQPCKGTTRHLVRLGKDIVNFFLEIDTQGIIDRFFIVPQSNALYTNTESYTSSDDSIRRSLPVPGLAHSTDSEASMDTDEPLTSSDDEMRRRIVWAERGGSTGIQFSASESSTSEDDSGQFSDGGR